jgi:uncharacterized Zn finger protein (UPF0148 family)
MNSAKMVSEVCPVCGCGFLRKASQKKIRCSRACSNWDALTPRAKEIIPRPGTKNKGNGDGTIPFES